MRSRRHSTELARRRFPPAKAIGRSVGMDKPVHRFCSTVFYFSKTGNLAADRSYRCSIAIAKGVAERKTLCAALSFVANQASKRRIEGHLVCGGARVVNAGLVWGLARFTLLYVLIVALLQVDRFRLATVAVCALQGVDGQQIIQRMLKPAAGGGSSSTAARALCVRRLLGYLPICMRTDDRECL